MPENENSCSEDITTDLSYIEISFQDLKNFKSEKYCPCNKDQELKFITNNKYTTSYPYPPWLPRREILKHKIRKPETYCIKRKDERKQVKKINSSQENSEINPNLEKSAEQINPTWARLLHLLAYSCFKNRNKEMGSTRKFMAYPLRHCYVTMHYEQAPRTPVPGWEPRRRFRGVSPPRFH